VSSYFPGRQGHGVLLLKGFGSDQVTITSLASQFPQVGWHVFTFDFSGHGRSPGALTFDNAQTDRLEILQRLARTKNVTPGQLALAWVRHKGDDILPIPGTTRRSHLEENVATLDLELSASDLSVIETAIPLNVASGARYPEQSM
jgi:pimeloyl-ACP methyl ester carboxylesterase